MGPPSGAAEASQTRARPDTDDQWADPPRYLTALRRGAWLMALIVVPLTATVLVLSLVLPKTYVATTRLVLEEPAGVLDTPSPETSARRLETIRTLLGSREVREGAAVDLAGESAETLEDKVAITVGGVADIVEIRASDGDARGAAAMANAVARTFLDARREGERRRSAAGRAEIDRAIRRLEAADAPPVEIEALRRRRSELSVSEVGAGAGLRIAELAQAPERPDSPRPVQNTIVAFFAALFLAVLAALGRELLMPRLTGPRQFAALTGLSPLVAMPAARRRRRAAAEAEAYQALAASIRLQLSDSQRIVLVTSPHDGGERAAVVTGLGRALAGSGLPALLVSADLREPALDRRLGVAPAPGLGEVLSTLEQHPGESAAELIRNATRSGERPERGELRALVSGDTSQHPAALLSGESLGTVFEQLGRSEYRYVIVEGPSLLGPIDGQLVARWADAVLVVARLDSMSPDDAVELGELLGGLRAPVLGSVVIGGTRVRYSLPPWTPVREGELSHRG